MTVNEWESDQAEWEMYVKAMRQPCRKCKQLFEGASWDGHCFNCHDLMANLYESGEDYIGIGSYSDAK